VAKKYFSRKGAKKPSETRQRFAPLRLCARILLSHEALFVQSLLRALMS
jgi:hypothetical protein